ncbi:hypothetical protein Droror1_Dr00000073, partial [Drosera rotundifolia]
ISILGNLLRWVASKLQHNFLAIGFRLVIAASGSGILSMPDKFSAKVEKEIDAVQGLDHFRCYAVK